MIQILWFNCIKSIFHQPTEFIRAQYLYVMRHLSLIAETVEILEKENPSLHSNMNYELFSQAITERRDLPLSSIPSEEDYNSALGVVTYKESKEDKIERSKNIKSFLVIVFYLVASLAAFTLGVKHDSSFLFGMGLLFLGYTAVFIAARESMIRL